MYCWTFTVGNSNEENQPNMDKPQIQATTLEELPKSAVQAAQNGSETNRKRQNVKSQKAKTTADRAFSLAQYGMPDSLVIERLLALTHPNVAEIFAAVITFGAQYINT